MTALYEDFLVEIGLAPDDLGGWLRVYLPDQNLNVLLALDGDRAAGYLLAWNVPQYHLIPCAPPSGYITHCYIVPAYRKQGVGKLLYADIRRWFESLNVHAVFLHAANDGARRYWEQHGFSAPVTRLKLELHV